jgi:hypothetical protein
MLAVVDARRLTAYTILWQSPEYLLFNSHIKVKAV